MTQVSLNSRVAQVPQAGERIPPPAPAPRRTEPPPISAGKGSQEQQAAQRAEEEARRVAEQSRLYDQEDRYGLYQGTEQFFVQVLAPREGQVLDTKPYENFLDLYKRLQSMTGQVLDRRV